MSEEAAPTEPAEPQEGGEPEAFDEERAKAKIAKANNEAKNLRQRLKELEPLAQKAKELEERDQTEAQKAAKRAAEAEQRAADAEAKALRYEVATDKGVPANLMQFLHGTDRDEIEKQADALLEAVKGTDAPRGRPRETLRPGTGGETAPLELDPQKLAEQIPRRW